MISIRLLNRSPNKIAVLSLLCRKSFKLELLAVNFHYDLLRAVIAVEVWGDGGDCVVI
jgi:hypothetical protein